MVLSDQAALIFVLYSGVLGRLTAGRVERNGKSGLDVYTPYGKLNGYISGARLRSWCIAGPTGKALPSWSEILPEDRARMLPDD